MTVGDWVDRMFPGNGMDLPSELERDSADILVGYKIARTRPQASNPDLQTPTNRAFVRASVRRRWRRSDA